MISEVTVHCSGTEKMQGFSWLEYLNARTMQACQSAPQQRCKHTGLYINYHYLILPNGNVVNARDDRSTGWHTPGRHQGNLGVCLIGGKNEAGDWVDNFTVLQKESLVYLLNSLLSKYRLPPEAVRGACDHEVPSGYSPTESPCFNVKDVVATLQGVPYGPAPTAAAS